MYEGLSSYIICQSIALFFLHGSVMFCQDAESCRIICQHETYRLCRFSLSVKNIKAAFLYLIERPSYIKYFSLFVYVSDQIIKQNHTYGESMCLHLCSTYLTTCGIPNCINMWTSCTCEFIVVLLL